MKKILILLLLSIMHVFSNEVFLASEKLPEPLYNTDTVEYNCKEGYVVAKLKNSDNIIVKELPIVWYKENNNKVVKLECKDFKIWSNT